MSILIDNIIKEYSLNYDENEGLNYCRNELLKKIGCILIDNPNNDMQINFENLRMIKTFGEETKQTFSIELREPFQKYSAFRDVLRAINNLSNKKIIFDTLYVLGNNESDINDNYNSLLGFEVNKVLFDTVKYER